MLDIDLIPDLRSKGNFLEKQKSKIMPSSLIFAQVEEQTVLPLTINLGGGRGGGMHKTTSGSHYLYI
jgi:hypothetical protein